MERATELYLLEELLGLHSAQSAYLDDTIFENPVSRYNDPAHFQQEQAQVFRRFPQLTVHASELPDAGSFLRKEIAGLPVLLTRDRDGKVHAFLNVCRHRGARLVEDEKGCRNAFSCPYHAWTFSNQGDLRGIPHEKQGFPGVDKSKMGLIRLPAAERLGWIWVLPDPNGTMHIDAFVAPLVEDFGWLDTAKMKIAVSDTLTVDANWKLLIEGGIEAYHFKVTHKHTIGPHFLDNLSSYRMLGKHMRSVLPRAHLADLQDMPREDWDIRRDANVLYCVFPLSQLLVMQDHIAWIHATPLNEGQTELRLSTVVPASSNLEDSEQAEHWKRNHAITKVTLSEDFEVNAGAQAGLGAGANRHVTFGRFEGALAAFNQTVMAAMEEEQA
ncbi:aromatic ring-hydroxylating dioxygenase subunit alpha [Shimia sp. SDUM112013]|uniref:aromatic ring-hydroxylating oxygenase subunit alpha n=1 Tax=Shimia sp. SDUM112013 TaxID=3136160 RepID=UPI0032EF29D0